VIIMEHKVLASKDCNPAELVSLCKSQFKRYYIFISLKVDIFQFM
jgi:hypothetical protein